MIAATTTKTEYFKLGGGIDMVSPHLSIAPGFAIDAVNYEPGLYGGYSRMQGFERYDGRPSPSAAIYYTLSCSITGAITVGNTVTGATSGATGVVLQVNAAELVLTKVTGTFAKAESLLVSGVTQATTTAIASRNGALTGILDAAYAALAADSYRADIQVVPGSGPIRGVWLYNDIVYAFRDNAGITAGTMWKSSAAGWVSVTLGRELAFNTGTAIISEGQTVTGFTSGASGVVTRVVLQTGAWSGTAAGYLTFASVTGAFQNGESLRVGGVAKATSGGVDAAITLPAGGRYEFVNYNFTGSTQTLRMYGANGVGNAFEFDGATFVKIRTGMTADTPNMITAHRNHLFLAFNGSLQHSSPGFPYQWSVVVGAGELGMGDTITGLLPQAGSATSATMLVLTRHQAYVLNGTSVANWVLSVFSIDIGAVAYTGQTIGTAVFMDDRGVTEMQASLNYGNFDQATVSRRIQPLIDSKRGMVTASAIVRSKNQYRVFFNDGTFLVMALTKSANQMGNVVPAYEFTKADYGKVIRCICSGGLSSGQEALFFGSDDGYIYQAEKGTTMDGTAIQAWLRLPFHHSKSPRIRKRYRKALFEMDAASYASVRIASELGYGDPSIATNPVSNLSTTGIGGYWDAVNWNEFYWDGVLVSDVEMPLTGTAVNLSLLVYASAKELPHTLHGVIIHYTPRRLER